MPHSIQGFDRKDLVAQITVPASFLAHKPTVPATSGATLDPLYAQMAVPCGFDQFGRPIGLQLVGKPRGEATLLQAAALFEQLLGLDRLLPVDPKPGTVPPSI
jgi:Asp-tRNA(Asn)/Glu-tRNA(Gln) amidotransferase A subunit family amidase